MLGVMVYDCLKVALDTPLWITELGGILARKEYKQRYICWCTQFPYPPHSTAVVNSRYSFQTSEKDRHVGLPDEMKNGEYKTWLYYKAAFLLQVMDQTELG